MEIERARDNALTYLRHLAAQDAAPEAEVRAALEAVQAAVADELANLSAGRLERSEKLKVWRADKRRKQAEKVAAKTAAQRSAT